jgi:hypothetical protein
MRHTQGEKVTLVLGEPSLPGYNNGMPLTEVEGTIITINHGDSLGLPYLVEVVLNGEKKRFYCSKEDIEAEKKR